MACNEEKKEATHVRENSVLELHCNNIITSQSTEAFTLMTFMAYGGRLIYKNEKTKPCKNIALIQLYINDCNAVHVQEY